jgi:phytoene dehydrogenase-like protein
MDAIVIGSGPNGLTAAAALARAGWSVLLIEAKSRPGGAVWSEERTLPGFLHDVGAAFFPFARDSPAFRDLDLDGTGLSWGNAAWESCHPAADGTTIAIGTDVDRTAASFGVDGPTWRQLAGWQRDMGPRLAEALLGPLLNLGPAWRLGLRNLFRLARTGLLSTAGFSRRWFTTEPARRVIPGLALHVDLGPRDLTGAGLGLVLALLASDTGFRIPMGGAKSITQAMIRRLEEAGGTLRLDAHVKQIVVRQGRAVGVVLDGGEEIPAEKAVLADVGARALYLRMLNRQDVPGYVLRQIRRFRHGFGTFKMDWALSGPVPWNSAEARGSAVVHAADSLADLMIFTRQVRSGRLPTNPYLVIGQQSLVDPSRAPQGCHTLWAYSRVPGRIDGGWAAHREQFADAVEKRIEGLAPGFRRLIMARAVAAPPDLEAMDENLVDGDLGGGSAQVDHQFFLRPCFPYFNYATPIKGLYLASASAHPGAGVHGACGFNAARRALMTR